MSEPVAKQRPMIDLDEFERRLRRPTPSSPQRNADPLAELARLVDGADDPYEGVFQNAIDDGRQAQPRRMEADRAAGVSDRAMWTDPRAERPRAHDPVLVWPREEPVLDQQPRARVPGLGGDFAAIEAGLRGSIQPEFRNVLQPEYQEPAIEDDDDYWLDEVQTTAAGSSDRWPERSRSRHLLYITAAIVLIGIGGIGATFAIKRSPSSPQQIAMIKASTNPAKVQAPPPVQSDSAKAIQDVSLLDKTPQPPPVGLVDRSEQPVDLARAADIAPKAPSSRGAASVPVPQPPATDTAPNNNVSLAQPWQQGLSNPKPVVKSPPEEVSGLADLIHPRKVKTVTVRPDGTIVTDDIRELTPPHNKPALVSSAEPSSEPWQSGAPTTMARVEMPKATVRIPQNDTAASRIRAAKPAHAAAAKTAVVPAKPVKVANLDNGSDAASVAASGTFAVQLAAAPSEADARQAIVRLTHKYSGALAGHQLKWHRAKVGDKSFYRIRIGGLSRSAATTLCVSLQAKGGSCFVARD